MEYSEKYKNYQLNRSWLRKVIRKIYLSHTSKFVIGKAVDFGCGVGELLDFLPDGSIGLEINRHAVEYCQENNKNVEFYNLTDAYMFHNLERGQYNTFIINHVLEHIEDADQALKLIAKNISDMGIRRIILVVPGKKGFLYDKSHITYIDDRYITKKKLSNISGFKITTLRWFPINWKFIEKYFTHHEMMVIYDYKT